MDLLQRSALVEPEHGPAATESAPSQAGSGDPTGPAPWAAALLATVIPLVVAVVLIAVRGPLGTSVSLLMVTPVVTVAIVAGARAGAWAAVIGAAAYGFLHTQPYYRVTIDDSDDVVETIVLLVVGVAVGVIADRERRSRTITRARARELGTITEHLARVAGAPSLDVAARSAERAIATLLRSRRCEWRPGYHGSVGPVLRPDGSLSSGRSAPDAGDGLIRMPIVIELPVGRPGAELGRFVVQTDPSAIVSIEERRAAAAVAASLSAFVER